MKIVGVDNSVNSPGVVWFELDEKLEVKRKNFLGFTTVKKDATDNIIHFKKNEFSNGIEQYLWMRDKIFETVKKDLGDVIPDYVAIEDYSFASVGKVFNIAESTGALKVKFFENNVPIRLYDPASIKMYFSGAGNADKPKMKEAYDKLSEFERFKENINEDVIDAFAICKLLNLELKLRKGLIKLYDLDENTIRVFNRTTKAHKENLLVEEYIQKKE